MQNEGVQESEADGGVPVARTARERRRSRRYLCDGSAEVNLLERDTMFRGEIRNLSLEGCFVATRARIHIDQHNGATLRFNLCGRIFKTEAEVINIAPGVGVGFAFQHPTQRVAAEIRVLVEGFAQDPEQAAQRGRFSWQLGA